MTGAGSTLTGASSAVTSAGSAVTGASISRNAATTASGRADETLAESGSTTSGSIVDGPGAVETERPRCGWALSAPEYVAYHDDEWGVPLHGDDALFERMSLEAFQSGLSWITILRKRPAFRAAFAAFSIARVATFDDADVQRLLSDAGIVRNRQKIEAVLTNARLALQLDDGLDALLWSFAPGQQVRPATLAAVPATTAESTAMAKRLKQLGFRFVGPTTAYALMQATGMVDDHISTCWRATGS